MTSSPIPCGKGKSTRYKKDQNCLNQQLCYLKPLIFPGNLFETHFPSVKRTKRLLLTADPMREAGPILPPYLLECSDIFGMRKKVGGGEK